jgi:RNA polymerase sigma-70 factor (ECF subfamily)
MGKKASANCRRVSVIFRILPNATLGVILFFADAELAMEDSDYDLIRAIGAGDHLAFERLVRRYQGSILNFIHRQIGDRHTAEDLTQEAFLRVYRAASRFEERGKVSTWIFKIAYNLCLNEMKRLRRLKRFQLDLYDEGIRSGEGAYDALLGAHERDKDIMNALQKLPESQRAALLLRANEELSYSEISRVLSVSISSVESLIFRARKRLRQLLQDKEEE